MPIEKDQMDVYRTVRPFLSKLVESLDRRSWSALALRIELLDSKYRRWGGLLDRGGLGLTESTFGRRLFRHLFCATPPFCRPALACTGWCRLRFLNAFSASL